MKDLVYTDKINDKTFIIIKTQNMKWEYNNDEFLLYAMKITSDAVRISHNEKVTMIADLYNFKQKNISIHFVIKFVKIFKESFPDILEKCIIINSNSLFRHVFMLIKPFIDIVTLKKIDIRKNGCNIEDYSVNVCCSK